MSETYRTTARLEEMRKKLVEERVSYIDDEDIAIVMAWEHCQNVESSEKLLHRLKFYHGNRTNASL